MRVQRVHSEAKVRKVNCQECGQVKELGLRCEECGWPYVRVAPDGAGRFFVMVPLGPSTNDRMRPVNMGRYSRDILTDEARDYVATVASEVEPILERAAALGFRQIRELTPVEVWMVLPRRSCDPSNYEKCLWDALERAGFAKNDRYILPRFEAVAFDTQSTGVTVRA